MIPEQSISSIGRWLTVPQIRIGIGIRGSECRDFVSEQEKGWDNGWTLNGLSSGKYSTFDSIGVLVHYFSQLH